jgi:hypothetical protein
MFERLISIGFGPDRRRVRSRWATLPLRLGENAAITAMESGGRRRARRPCLRSDRCRRLISGQDVVEDRVANLASRRRPKLNDRFGRCCPRCRLGCPHLKQSTERSAGGVAGDVARGLDGHPIQQIPDRSAAIRSTVGAAALDDVVAIAWAGANAAVGPSRIHSLPAGDACRTPTATAANSHSLISRWPAFLPDQVRTGHCQNRLVGSSRLTRPRVAACHDESWARHK